MNKKLHLISLGCTKNLVDSEVMLGRLSTYTLTQELEEADVIIINTCGFIDAAKSESINTILDASDRRKEDSLLIVSGCLSERYREDLEKELPEVDLFTGVGDYQRIDELIAKKKNRYSDEVFLIKNEARVITGSSFHAYIKIAEGCNQACSFCAIPSFKGKLQSRPLEEIKKEVETLLKQGFQDFSFISQDSSSYLLDKGVKEGLVRLIESIEQIKGIKSARILYLYPSTTSDLLIDTIADSKIFQTYYDIPLQHISANMLKTMKRGVNQARHFEILTRMREKSDAFIRTTFILGHPGEEKSDFDTLKKFVQDFGFDRVNLFEYSDEEGTSAKNMPKKVSQNAITQRIRSLNKAIEKSTTDSLRKLLGKELQAVVLGVSEEHEYFYDARPLIWAPEIDGTILINESTVKKIEIDTPYIIQVTEIAGQKAIAKILRKC